MQGGEFIQLVEHFGRLSASLELNHDAHTAPVRFVTQVADITQPPIASQLCNSLKQGGLVELVGDFGDDDAVAVDAHFLDMGQTAQDQPAAPGAVGLVNTFRSHDNATGGEIRTGDMLQKIVQRQFVYIHRPICTAVVVDHKDHASHNFGQVVGRDIGRHAHCNTG